MPGNSFLQHRHEPTEVYFILAGEGIVSLDGVVQRPLYVFPDVAAAPLGDK